MCAVSNLCVCLCQVCVCVCVCVCMRDANEETCTRCPSEFEEVRTTHSASSFTRTRMRIVARAIARKGAGRFRACHTGSQRHATRDSARSSAERRSENQGQARRRAFSCHVRGVCLTCRSTSNVCVCRMCPVHCRATSEDGREAITAACMRLSRIRHPTPARATRSAHAMTSSEREHVCASDSHTPR